MATAARQGSGTRWGVVAVGVAVLAIGAWLAIGREPLDAERGALASEPAAGATPPDSADVPAAPPLRISENGRLTLESTSLPAAEPVALGLAMPDEARGSTSLPTRVVSTDGRKLETQARPIAGNGSGVRIDLEAGWLLPGRYLIEVETRDDGPLSLRRYVLEMQ